MPETTRRQFVSDAAKAIAVTGITSIANNEPDMSKKKSFVHHVYFWLKNPASNEDKQQLLQALRKLAKVKTIQMAHIGEPADTNREVIDRSYQVSWLLFFKNKADQDSYQVDPIHLKFVEECEHLWRKVIVYDTVNI